MSEVTDQAILLPPSGDEGTPPPPPEAPALRPEGMKHAAAQHWTGVLMRRMLCGTIEDTSIHYAKIKPSCVAGVPMFAVTSEVSQAEAECALNQRIYCWAYTELLASRMLPVLESQTIEPCHAVMGVMRINRLKDLLRLKAKQFGLIVKAVPADTVARVTLEVDAVLTRHAMHIR